MEDRFDLIVIGTGPAGYVAAIKAAQLGMKTAVLEESEVGGTCLNRGCIPTKTLMHTAHLLQEIKNCGEIGIHIPEVSYDIQKIQAHKDEVLDKLRSGIEQLFKSNKVTLFRGKGKILSAGRVSLLTEEGEMVLSADKILIATGSKPAKPPIIGLDLPEVITSDELLSMRDKVYKRLVMIGGGVIGVEFATIFNALGSEVTIIEALDRILPTMDREISQNLGMILKKRGVAIHAASKVEKITEENGALSVYYEEKGEAKSVDADGVLVAIGRRANIEGLFAEGFGVECERGAVMVNERFETSVPGIYAVGDAVFGTVQLAHMASAQAVNAVCAMNGKEMPIDLSIVPGCVYTDPEIATVGLSADEAKAKNIPVKTGKFLMSANGKSVLSMQERGFIKVVFDEKTDVILGAQMMCGRATDMISELSTAIHNKLTSHELAAVIRPHPTFSEGVTEAVESAEGTSIHTAPRR